MPCGRKEESIVSSRTSFVNRGPCDCWTTPPGTPPLAIFTTVSIVVVVVVVAEQHMWCFTSPSRGCEDAGHPMARRVAPHVGTDCNRSSNPDSQQKHKRLMGAIELCHSSKRFALRYASSMPTHTMVSCAIAHIKRQTAHRGLWYRSSAESNARSATHTVGCTDVSLWP